MTKEHLVLKFLGGAVGDTVSDSPLCEPIRMLCDWGAASREARIGLFKGRSGRPRAGGGRAGDIARLRVFLAFLSRCPETGARSAPRTGELAVDGTLDVAHLSGQNLGCYLVNGRRHDSWFRG